MSVRIRLKRFGTKKRPFYRIVVMDSRTPRDGRVLEEVGLYHPIEPKEKQNLHQRGPREGLAHTRGHSLGHRQAAPEQDRQSVGVGRGSEQPGCARGASSCSEKERNVEKISWSTLRRRSWMIPRALP